MLNKFSRIKKSDNNQGKIQDWAYDQYGSMRASRDKARIAAITACVLLALSLCANLAIFPLKTTVPYVITIDKNTGATEIARPLERTGFTEKQQVTQSYVENYVIRREGYNRHVLDETYNEVRLKSTGLAQKEFQELYDGDNPDNPSLILGLDGFIDVTIISTAFLNDNKTASVRFKTTTRLDRKITTQYWHAFVTYRYAKPPEKADERRINPVGFQVLSYRKSSEQPS